ncbi:glycosyltransferase family 2 protein [Bradyrhizobium sp. G127]|jgi:cellulose synthase/poly-beta-1,6-N-acetylglucosamine synthase-like glycosyltransferase|uniref:glycosyltransferase family 2 protein n=1 Tax=Bradyrhizobium sp. G127 TaxID=2904800 RepID=UPI001F2D9019|nr:glycosyltransferase family 2 protein [Bradyrhizobium sp. G127]MCF2525131.1 glycosyltransferase [Bradyrhizobium sp. G127]
MAVAGRANESDESAWRLRFADLATSARNVTSVLAGFLGFPQSQNDNRPRQREPGPAVELDCLRHVLAPSLLAAAEQRSDEIGVGADQVLIQWGVIEESVYLDRLAAHSGLRVETLSNTSRADCLLPDDQVHLIARHGMLPIRGQHGLVLVSVPRGYTVRRTLRRIAQAPSLRERLRLTSTAHLNEFLEAESGGLLERVAADGLAARFPELSAAPMPVSRGRMMSIARSLARLAGPIVLLTLAPLTVIDVSSVILAIWFLLFTSLRLAGCFSPRKRHPRLPRLHDSQLPVYTVVAALYREASSVAPLMRYIDELDYPREKLDIKFVIEPDDLGTRAAIARLGPMPHVQVIIAPDAGPRTKPKALNCALTFARGTFITVFDAEDRPEPGQLRAALDVFRTHDPDVVCAQASLCIDNTADGWLPRMFTAEYAGQFDVFLQGFSNFEMPLPLGGSSNHFRTCVLREVGGWDPYNVTEDADLGFRLARFKYRSVMFPSTTFEEAPARFGAWLRQRSRWMKGWMQTWSVHMRSPRQLWRDAGAGGFFTLNIIVGGNVLTALAHPLLLGEILVRGVLSAFDSSVSSFFTKPFIELYLATIAAGYLTTVVIGLMGLARRGLLHEAWVLALTPIYWVCLSIAAWRALYQLLKEPYRWEKTEHGLARTSRISRRPQSRRMRGAKSWIKDSA